MSCHWPECPHGPNCVHAASAASEQERRGGQDWDGLEWLVPLLGEANVRRILDSPATDEQRRRIAEIVADAPTRVG